MALCHRQCPNCVNLVTVLVDAEEHAAQTGNHIVDIRHDEITAIYNRLLEELGDSQDIAVILRINGVDVAAKCSRSSGTEDECELF